MFFCIGENQVKSCSKGRGETVAQAIKAWAYAETWGEVIEEFNNYSPTVVEGTELGLEIEVPEPKITIHN